jgi:hypothetical protein
MVSLLRYLSRREFLAIGGSVAVSALAGTRFRARQATAASPQTRVIYRLSLRGRRGSIAAKRHDANMRFATESAADLHRAHPGDHSRIVPLRVSEATFDRLFPTPESLVADLRKVVLGCIGDCNRNTHVTVDEILTMVNGALGNSDVSACHVGDANKDGRITVDEILTAVNNALNGCGS